MASAAGPADRLAQHPALRLLIDQGLQMLEGHHPFDRVFADRQTTQENHVRAAAELLTEIIDNGADIGPFRAVYFQLEFITFVANEQQLIDGNRTGFRGTSIPWRAYS